MTFAATPPIASTLSPRGTNEESYAIYVVREN
jgi:hypothetical protein